ncbi:MAG: hypothetical protein ACYCTD_06860 [bacterium]
MPTLAIIAGPITLIFGAATAYNVLAILALPLSAYSAFLLLRYITKDSYASFVGGYLFGFSSFEIAEYSGHIFLYFSFIIPLLILLVIKRFHKDINRFLFIILFALAMAFEVGISEEIAFTATFFGFISFIIFYIFANNKYIRFNILKLIIDTVLAYCAMAILLLPFLYYFVIGFSQAPKVLNSPTFYSADLLNYIIPTPLTRLGRVIFENITSRFTGNYSEDGAYFGIILVIAVIFAIKEQLKNWWGKATAAIVIVLFVSSLGPYLHINGINTKIPLLWQFVVNLPVFRDALPTRFTMYVFLIASFFIALWLSKQGISKKNKLYRYIIVFFGLIILIPNTNMWHWNTVNTPLFFQNKNIMKKFINKGDNVLIFPYNNGYGGTLDYEQVVSNMYFKMPEGRLTFMPKKFSKWPAVSMFLSNKIVPDYAFQISAFVSSKNIKVVILAPGTAKIWYRVFNRMHWKKFKTGGVNLYKVPDALFQKFKNITILQVVQGASLSTFNRFYNSSIKFSNNDESLSNLYPKYLEAHGYLSKLFGYETGKANNWTTNGGWIGRWGCPDGKGECFGVGIVGNINSLRPIIQKYQPSAEQIFFPYPKVYNTNSSKGSGQLLMIFRLSKNNTK